MPKFAPPESGKVVKNRGDTIDSPFPWAVRFPSGKLSVMATKAGAEALAQEIPDPVPPDLLRHLVEGSGWTQGDVARAMHVLPQTLRKWLAPPEAASHRAPPWAALELFRRQLIHDDELM